MANILVTGSEGTLGRYLVAELRSRRRVGQIFTASASIYAKHFFAFLTLGLLAFPVGLAVSAGHNALLSGGLPVLDLGLPYAGVGLTVAAALAFHGLAFGLTAIIVFAASIAVIAQIERGESGDAVGAILSVFRKLPQLVASTAVAAVVVAALCVTLVGIPLGLRQAARWSLNTHALLLRDVSGRRSLSSSAGLVTMARWHAFVTTALLLTLAMLAAPALGIVLLWFVRSLDPAYVGLISATLHAMLVPFIAIAMSLLYFDLESRHEPEASRR